MLRRKRLAMTGTGMRGTEEARDKAAHNDRNGEDGEGRVRRGTGTSMEWGRRMRTIELAYRPTKKQAAFHGCGVDEALYGGAAGGGKSKAIVMDALARCLAYPGTKAYIFRRTYRELEDSVIAEARMSYPREVARYNVTRHEMDLINGSQVRFRHCANAADMYEYAGCEIQWLYFDELTSFERDIYDFLKTRLRARRELGVRPVVRCASNPGNVGHAWVKAMFVDPAPPMQAAEHRVYSRALGRERVFTTEYIPSLPTENPYLSEDYLFELERKPQALRRALLEGGWDAFEGQVFTEWRDERAHYQDRRWTHVVEPFPVPLSWPRFMSFDHGYTRPFSCGWWAVSPEGRAYRYREWYGYTGVPDEGQRLSPGEIARGILDREREAEAREGIHVDRICDPAIFDASRGDSVARQMEAAGVYFRRGDNSRLAGKMQMHERLRFDEGGRPQIQVFSTCRDFIRTVPALCYDPGRCEDVDTRGEDHIYDETRYFLMSRVW